MTFTQQQSYDPSAESLRPLLNTFWGPDGSRDQPQPQRRTSSPGPCPRLKPSAADLDLGRRLVELLRTCPESMTSTKILPSLRILPGNKAERSVLLDIFGVCGILQTPHHRGYANAFVAADHREVPPRRFVDSAYPVCWWTGRDGVNEESLAQFLPQLTS